MGEVELDQEWVQLITEARKVGIQKEDISLFLKEKVIDEPISSRDKYREKTI